MAKSIFSMSSKGSQVVPGVIFRMQNPVREAIPSLRIGTPLSTAPANPHENIASPLEEPMHKYEDGIERRGNTSGVHNCYKEPSSMMHSDIRIAKEYKASTKTHEELGKSCIDQVVAILSKGFQDHNTNDNSHH